MGFWPTFDIFHRLRPYLYSKQVTLRFYRGPGDGPFFFTLGSTVHDWGWPKNGPFYTKHGRLFNLSKWSKRVIKGPKSQPLCFFTFFGPFWAHMDPFGPFQTKIDSLLRSTSAKPYFVHLGQKIHFCLKWRKRVQMGPKGSPLWMKGPPSDPYFGQFESPSPS